MVRTKSSNSNKMEGLLQQLQRQFIHHGGAPSLPPSAAASRFGQELCREFLNLSDSETPPALVVEMHDKIVTTLCQSGLHPSVPHAFFDAIHSSIIESQQEQQRSSTQFTWISAWLLQIEELVRSSPASNAAASESLSGCIRAYATYYILNSTEGGETYSRLELISSRSLLTREIFSCIDLSRMIPVVSPMLSITVLSRPSNSSSHVVERSSFVQQLIRAIWVLWSPEIPECWDVMLWLTKAWNLFFASSSQSATEDRNEHMAVMELAESWLLELIVLAQALCRGSDPSEALSLGGDRLRQQQLELQQYALLEWCDTLLCDSILPLIAAIRRDPQCTILRKPLYSALASLVEAVHLNINSFLTSPKQLPPAYPLDPLLLLEYSSLIVSTYVAEERELLLQILYHLSSPTRLSHSSVTSLCLLEAISCIFIHDQTLRDQATMLQSRLQSVSDSRFSRDAPIDRISVGSRLFGGPISLVDRLMPQIDVGKKELSLEQQTAALLVAVSRISTCPTGHDWYSFLTRLVDAYPYQGITVLPILLQLVNTTASVGSCRAKDLMYFLELLAGPLVKDPHGAQEVWALLVNQWMSDPKFMGIRVAIIRLFIKVCVNNKRMYSRVVGVLGACWNEEKDPEIKLACIRTVCDLAKEDCIRDVSDVIGWIQTCLTEEERDPIHALIKHYALLSLHHLTRNDELEFSLVIKVLSKRLCPISSRKELLALPLVVLEALILLLGDGEVDSGDSSEEGEDGNTSNVVPLQVTQSIDALIFLGNSLSKRKSSKNSQVLQNCRQNIIWALAQYSFAALELDEEAINAALIVAAAEEDEESDRPSMRAFRYMDLRDLVVDGLDGHGRSSDHRENPVITLGRRLASYEEDILGSTFWEKRRTLSKGERRRREELQHRQSMTESLPKAADFGDLPNSIPAFAIGIGKLLAADGSSLSVLRDNADASIEFADPLFLAFAVKGYLQLTSLCLEQSHYENPLSVFDEIRSWNEVFVSPDAMLLLLASLAFSVSGHSTPDDEWLAGVDAAAEEVVMSFQGNGFQEDSIGKVSLGICGMIYVRRGMYEKALETVDSLEQSVRGYGGQQDFGAYFGVSLVAQTAASTILGDKHSLRRDEACHIIQRVTAFIVEELLACFEDAGTVTVTLLACLKTGKATPGLADSLGSLGSNSHTLLMTKNVIARCLLISASWCIPALAEVDGDLLLAVFRLIEAFEWTGGKGIAVAAILQRCETAHLLPANEIDQIHNEYASVFQRRVDSGHAESEINSDGLDDIFYAVNGMSAKATPHFVRRLLIGNKELFDDDGCATTLIACVLSVTSVPALGIGSFTDAPLLREEASVDDVRTITGYVLEAARMSDHSKYSSVGVVLLGMLTSTKLKLTEDSILQRQSSFETKSTATEPACRIDFEKFPRPQVGTLSDGVVAHVQNYYKRLELDDAPSLTESFAILESLSLPGVWASQVMEVHLNSFGVDCDTVIKLLCSQVRGRRSALQDGREFITLVNKLAKLSPEDWIRTIPDETARRLFIQRLHELLPKLSSGAFDTAIRSVWRRCTSDTIKRPREIIVFFTSITTLMEGRSMSPKASAIVHDFVCTDCYREVMRHQLHRLLMAKEGDISVMHAFIRCFQSISLSTLETLRVLQLDGKGHVQTESVRAYILLKILRIEGFVGPQQRSLWLKEHQTWLIQRLLSTSSVQSIEADSVRRLHVLYGSLTQDRSYNERAVILLGILDAMLISGVEGILMSIELVGVLLNTWLQDSSTPASSALCKILSFHEPSLERLTPDSLQELFEILTTRIPRTLAHFVQHSDRAIFLNKLQRVQVHVLQQGLEDLADMIQKAVFSCQRVSDKDSAFVAESLQYLES